MIDTDKFFDHITSQGITTFAGVPDSLLKNLCSCIEDRVPKKNHIITSNEGAAIGYGIGSYLATSQPSFIYLQNSGIGNIVNPLLSLASSEVYGIPMIIMIGWRGMQGIKDEPQHTHQGRVMIETIEAMEIPYFILDEDESAGLAITSDAIKTAIKNKTPVIIVVKKNTFKNYKKNKNEPYHNGITREAALIGAVDLIPVNSIVVSTTGMLSRELFEYRASLNDGHHKDFLTVGGMGHANQIALGIANSKPSSNVFCFDGDGAALMHLGSLAIIGQSNIPNYVHIIFNNGAHDSVGGQPTVGKNINFCGIGHACGYKTANKVTTKEQLKDVFQEIESLDGPHLIDFQVVKGNRDNIGRPTSSPEENKILLMDYIRNSTSPK